MNKKQIDAWIPKAYTALETVGIAKDKAVEKNYRGQIATFGASVAMGSVISAIAFFSDPGKSDAERPKLLQAMYLLICKDDETSPTLFDYAKKQWGDKVLQAKFTEEVLNAAVALKLAMNLYKLIDKQPKGGKGESA